MWKPKYVVGKLNWFLFCRYESFSKVRHGFRSNIWYNDLDGDHKRTLNKYVGALTKLLNMTGWSELIEVLASNWDNEKMVFRFKLQKSPRQSKNFETASTHLI